jgi:AbrB family looped-hinge helix DNA binding protein
MDAETRIIGERGQVTIPKDLRERFDIRGGDEVVVREVDGRIVIETGAQERLAEGYRRRADRDRAIDRAFAGTSREADAKLGDAPEW